MAEPKIAVIDRTETAQGYAHDRAVHRWNSQDFFGKAVFGSMLRDSRKQQYTDDAMDKIVAEQEPLLYAARDDMERQDERDTVLARTLIGDPDTFRTDERWPELPVAPPAASSLKRPIHDYVKKGRSDDWLIEHEADARTVLYANRAKDLAVSADNSLEIAKLVRDAGARGKDSDRMLEDMKVVTSKDLSGSLPNSHPHRNWFGRTGERIRGSKFGSVVQPEVIVPLVTIAIVSGVSYLSSRAASIKTAASLSPSALRGMYEVVSRPSLIPAMLMTAIPAAAGGLWMGFRESRHMREDRAQVMRDLAQGKVATDKDTLRRQLEMTGYSMVPASQLTDKLLDSLDRGRLAEVDGWDQAIATLAEAIARREMVDQQGIYSISYSSPAATVEERWRLDEAIAKAKTDLRGMGKKTDFDVFLKDRADEFTGTLTQEIVAKDKAFDRIRRKAALSAGVQGAVVGLLAGLAIQETDAAFDSKSGLMEQLLYGRNPSGDDVNQQTLLDAIVHGRRSATDTYTTALLDFDMDKKTVLVGHDTQPGDPTISTIEPSSTYHDYTIGDHGTLSLSNDHSIMVNEDGTLNLVAADGDVTIEHLRVNPDGSLPEESLEILRQHEMVVSDNSYQEPFTTREAKTVSVDAYMNTHQDATHQVERDAWMLNDTPCCGESDHNELALDWGGSDGTGVTGDGTVQMSFASATPDGSFQDGLAVNPQEAAENGELALLVTPTHDWESQPIVVPFASDGTVDIGPDSPAAPFFDINESGHAYIKADFVEVAQVSHVDDAGTTHVNVLATAAGTHNDGCLDTNPHLPPIEEVTYMGEVHHERRIFDYEVTTNGYEKEIPTTDRVPIYQAIPVPKFAITEGSDTVTTPAAVIPAIVLPLARRRTLLPAAPPSPKTVAPVAVVAPKPTPARRNDWYVDKWPKPAPAPVVPVPPKVTTAKPTSAVASTETVSKTPSATNPSAVPVIVNKASATPVTALVPIDEPATPVVAPTPADRAVVPAVSTEKPSVIALGGPVRPVRKKSMTASSTVEKDDEKQQEQLVSRPRESRLSSVVSTGSSRVKKRLEDKRMRNMAIGAVAVSAIALALAGAKVNRRK